MFRRFLNMPLKTAQLREKIPEMILVNSDSFKYNCIFSKSGHIPQIVARQ